MRRHHAILFTFAVLGGLPVSVCAAPSPVTVPLDSFLNQHVANLSELSQQVTLDPVVRRRLARHFHTSGPAIVRYIQNNLVLKRTTTAQRYQVYCISSTGREYTINSRLPVGTPVFVMRTTGKPILKLACGNPMVAKLDYPPTPFKTTSPELASLPTPAPAAITPVLASDGPTVVAMNSGPGIYVTPVATKLLPSIQSLGGGRFPIGYLAGIPIIAGIISHGTSTGGTNTDTTGTTGPGTTGPGTTGPGTTGPGTTGPGTTGPGTTGPGTTGPGTDTGTVPPVPEPSTPAAFAVGVAGLVYLLAGARRRSRKVKN